MSTRTRKLTLPRLSIVVWLAVAIAATLAACGPANSSDQGTAAPTSTEAGTQSSSLSQAGAQPTTSPLPDEVQPESEGDRQGRAANVANPVRVTVRRLHISARIQPLHLSRHGVLVPPQYGSAGWYAAGPEPGETGPAVIAGHLDSKNGPDVFAKLGKAKRGDQIKVGLAHGKALTFRVTEVKQFAQKHFPTKRVYGDTDQPAMRLITCGGDYDHNAGHYLDNVVVFAKLAR